MEILNHRHSAIIVNDLNEMVNFYVALGFRETRRDIETGEFISHMIDVPQAHLLCAKIALKNGYTVELIKYINPVANPKILPTSSASRYSHGLDHLGFTVDNIDEVVKFIVASGGRLISSPMLTNPGLPSRHAYVEDPEGNLIHLAENVYS
jgi:catechol 2,3-dioxygenase-like lactoylglutathione lyase family enzyme